MALTENDYDKNLARLHKGGHTLSGIAKDLNVWIYAVVYALKGKVVKPNNRIENHIVELLKNCPEL